MAYLLLLVVLPAAALVAIAYLRKKNHTRETNARNAGKPPEWGLDEWEFETTLRKQGKPDDMPARIWLKAEKDIASEDRKVMKEKEREASKESKAAAKAKRTAAKAKRAADKAKHHAEVDNAKRIIRTKKRGDDSL